MGGPKHLCWDEAGNLYVIGSDGPPLTAGMRTNLYYQASTDGGSTFGPLRTIFQGSLDTAFYDGEGVIGGAAGELHVAYMTLNGVLYHSKITDAHTANPIISTSQVGSALGNHFVRCALTTNTNKAVIGYGGGGSAAVVFEL